MHRELVDRLEALDQGVAVLVDKLGVVLAKPLVAEDRVLGRELASVDGRQILPVDIGLDLIDEIQFVDHLRQLAHGVGDHVAGVHVVDEVEALEDRGVGAAVDRRGRVEETAVVSGDLDHAAEDRSAGLLGLGLGDGFLLFLLLFCGGVLLLLLHGLLFGLLLGLLLGLRLDLCGCLLPVVVVVTAADQGESGGSDSCSGAGPEEAAPRHPVSAHPGPIVSLGHRKPFPLGPESGKWLAGAIDALWRLGKCLSTCEADARVRGTMRRPC